MKYNFLLRRRNGIISFRQADLQLSVDSQGCARTRFLPLREEIYLAVLVPLYSHHIGSSEITRCSVTHNPLSLTTMSFDNFWNIRFISYHEYCIIYIYIYSFSIRFISHFYIFLKREISPIRYRHEHTLYIMCCKSMYGNCWASICNLDLKDTPDITDSSLPEAT